MFSNTLARGASSGSALLPVKRWAAAPGYANYPIRTNTIVVFTVYGLKSVKTFHWILNR